MRAFGTKKEFHCDWGIETLEFYLRLSALSQISLIILVISFRSKKMNINGSRACKFPEIWTIPNRNLAVSFVFR